MHEKLFVIFSVDWEPNHGPWDHGNGTARDYGGVLKATPLLEQFLQQQGIPCSWFVEASRERERDLPRLFPEVVARLAARPRDEIGLHVHWRRTGADGRLGYETKDREWVRAQISDGADKLAECGARPASFRSGALLHVGGLPAILEELGFTSDSSTLWGAANRVSASGGGARRKHAMARLGSVAGRLFGPPLAPYFPDPEDVEKRGGSRIIEFPIYASVLEGNGAVYSALHAATLSKAAFMAAPAFLTYFFHIDELLDPRSGANEAARVDEGAARLLARRIGALRARADVEFLTMSRAREKFFHIAIGEKEHGYA